jgi:hypothetical protein
MDPFIQAWMHFSSLAYVLLSCPRNSPWFNLPNNICARVQMLLSLRNFFQADVTASLLGPNILLSTLFSNILSVYSSLHDKDQFSDPYKIIGNIIVLGIWIFRSVDRCFEKRSAASLHGLSQRATSQNSWSSHDPWSLFLSRLSAGLSGTQNGALSGVLIFPRRMRELAISCAPSASE